MLLDDQYVKNRALNQSLLKHLIKGSPGIFLYKLSSQENQELNDDDEPSENILMGSAVDVLMTSGEEAFLENFVVSDIERPKGQVGDFAWHLHIYEDENLAYLKTGTKTKRETFMAKFEKQDENGVCARDYYEFLKKNKGKTTITTNGKIRIDEVVQSLRSNRYVSHYFNQSERYENRYQVPLNFLYEGTECKGLVDIVSIDHEERTITPIDLKVTQSDTWSWRWIFWKMRYDFQAAFYVAGFHFNPPHFVAKLIHEGYKWKSFEFVVESYSYPGAPICYEMTPEIIEIGTSGGKRDGRTYEGFRDAIKRYKWHTENELWDYPMEVYEGNGKVKLS